MYGFTGYQQPQQPMFGVYQQPQQIYQQPRADLMQTIQPQQSSIQARPVTGREEAIAATVFPGSPMLFLDRAHGAVYYKSVDPQSNSVEFVDFIVPQPIQTQPPAPQYATMADLAAIRDEMSQLREMIPAQPTRRTKGVDSE